MVAASGQPFSAGTGGFSRYIFCKDFDTRLDDNGMGSGRFKNRNHATDGPQTKDSGGLETARCHFFRKSP